MKGIGLLLLLATALVVAGCGGGSEETGEGVSSAVPAAQDERASGAEIAVAAGDRSGAKRGARVTVVDSQFGRVVADRRGEALYLFDREKRGKSECYGACARAWPPLLTKGSPKALGGAKQGLLGTTRRADGRLQVTYAGQPLYYYVDDEPGLILCQDVVEFGGTWLVVEPSGAAVR